MEEQTRTTLSEIRKLLITEGISVLSIPYISKRLGISQEEFIQHIGDENHLVSKLLEFERDSFEAIFDEFNFDGMNAIEILLIVSREIALRYYDVTPQISMMLKQRYPEIYQDHLQRRIDSIFEKIMINLQKGINQGMYRPDLSTELMARLYLSRLIDIHNETIFPPEQFSFKTLFDVMFDSFVRSIATPNGLSYYDSMVKTIDWSLMN